MAIVSLVRIAIAGPGRSGTTLLVRLFAAWGFAVPPRENNWHEDARAGLETRIDPDSIYEVQKDTFAYEYLDQIDPVKLLAYDAFIVPIRDHVNAAISRSVQERWLRATAMAEDQWRWDSWGSAPGGAVVDTSLGGIAQTQALGLWKLLEKCAKVGISPRFLHFPRFAVDFDYLWQRLGDVVSARCSEESARQIWTDLARPETIRIAERSRSEVAEVRELQALVEVLRSENRDLRSQVAQQEQMQSRLQHVQLENTDLNERLSQALDIVSGLAAERDRALARVDLMLQSRIWRLTGWWRSIRSANRPK